MVWHGTMWLGVARHGRFLKLALGPVNHWIRNERDPFPGSRHPHERLSKKFL